MEGGRRIDMVHPVDIGFMKVLTQFNQSIPRRGHNIVAVTPTSPDVLTIRSVEHLRALSSPVK